MSNAAKIIFLVAVLTLAGAGAAVHGGAATTGLVAYYRFDEGSGTVARDSSGNSNDGTISNATWVTGKLGKALSFNGRNSWVTVPDAPSLDLTGGMTIEAWVNPATTGGSWRTVAVKEQPSQLAYALYAYGAGPGPSAHAYTTTDRYATTPSTLPKSTWTHLAGTYDGTTLRLYVGGQQVSATTAAGAITQSNGVLRIGGNAVWSEWFSGSIDDVRIYNKALSSSQISGDMSGSSPVPDTTAPSAPRSPVVNATTTSSITISWAASTDDTGVAGYGEYRNGALVSTTTGTSYTYTGLNCGTTYTLGIDAYDSAKNRSAQTTFTAPTLACQISDSQAPSAPASLRVVSSDQSSISLAWNASTDNVGVIGYGVYKNGVRTGSTNAMTVTFGSLSCGANYTIGVDAFD